MIAYMYNHLRSVREPLSQLKRKEKLFINIAQPFSNEATQKSKITQTRLRADDLSFDPARGQALQHHGAEPLHALLLIGRIITEQQNHWVVPVLEQGRVIVRHKPIDRGPVSSESFSHHPAAWDQLEPARLPAWQPRPNQSQKRRTQEWWVGRIVR